MKGKPARAAVIMAVFLAADWLQEMLYLLAPYKNLYEQYPYHVPESLKSLLQVVLDLFAELERLASR